MIYRRLQTYKSSGTIQMEIDTGEAQTTLDISFSVLLKKPNQYLISWESKLPFASNALSGTAWSDGTQPHLYMGLNDSYSAMENDHAALSMAWAFSGGAAVTVPGPFLSLSPPLATPLYDLVNPTLEGVESIAGDECYVISGSTLSSKKESVWISTTSFLIRKLARSLEPPQGGPTAREPAEDQLETALKATGQEVNEVNKQRTRNLMKTSLRDSTDHSGVSAEIHVDISLPELTTEDFQFRPPEGATLTKHLLGQPRKRNTTTNTRKPDDGGIQARHDEARLLLAEGRYAEATPEFVWLWNNMAKVAPSMGAVRRSFTAASIAKLCARHQPARKQFTAIRDLAGQAPLHDYETLWDFLTLCEYMGDLDVGTRWFDAHKHELPRTLTPMLRSFLRKAGRWEDMAQLDGDAIALLRQRQRWITELDASDDSRTREVSETSLRKLAGELYAAKLAAGLEKDAAAVAQHALETDRTPAMRRALVATALEAKQPRAIQRTWLTAPMMKDEPVARLLGQLDSALKTSRK